jgi:hypothetical protein
MLKNSKSLTLMELLVCLVLLSIIVLGISQVHIFSIFQARNSDIRAKLQNEVSIALEHMSKHFAMAIGDANNVPVLGYADNRGIRIRIDDNPANGRLDAADHWIGYRHEGSQIKFFPNDPDGSHSLTSEVIADHILITSNPALPESAANLYGLRIDYNNVFPINTMDITIRARWNPAAAVSANNPEVVMQTTVIAHSVSTH